MFNPEPVYGQVAAMRELTKAAPISGAPLPGSSTTSKPATQGGPGPVPAGPMAMPFAAAPSGAEYYQRLAATWRALATSPGASDEVKMIARTAKKRIKTQFELAAQGAG